MAATDTVAVLNRSKYTIGLPPVFAKDGEPILPFLDREEGHVTIERTTRLEGIRADYINALRKSNKMVRGYIEKHGFLVVIGGKKAGQETAPPVLTKDENVRDALELVAMASSVEEAQAMIVGEEREEVTLAAERRMLDVAKG